MSLADTTVFDGSVEDSHATSTARTYAGRMNRFGVWARGNPAFAHLVREAQGSPGKLTIDTTQLLDLYLEPFIDFLCELQDREDEDGTPTPESYASLKVYRSALESEMASQGVTLPPSVEFRLNTAFQDLCRRDARLREAGCGRLEETSVPMPLTVTRAILQVATASSDPLLRAAACFLLLQWSTCSRSGEIARMQWGHMSIENDSLVVYCWRGAGDGVGVGPGHKGHIYANPTDPGLCPFLHLGLYLLEARSDSDLVFGDDADKSFSDALSKLLRMERVALAVRESGLRPSQLGACSVRTGAAFFACGGIQSIGMMSACITSERQLVSLMEKYIEHQMSGDCGAGRMVTTISPMQQEFALLPPHFPPCDEAVSAAVLQLFPEWLTSRRSMQGVLQACVAQFVHHRAFLLDTLDNDHPLILRGFLGGRPYGRESVTQPLVYAMDLKSSLVTGYSSPHMQATGVPGWLSYITRLRSAIGTTALQVEELQRRSNELQRINERHWLSLHGDEVAQHREQLASYPASHQSPPDTATAAGSSHQGSGRQGIADESIASVRQERATARAAEERQGASSEDVTRENTAYQRRVAEREQELMEQNRNGSELLEESLAAAAATSVAAATTVPEGASAVIPSGRIWSVAGKVSMVPPRFAFPSKVTTECGWRLWMRGDRGRGVRAYRNFKGQFMGIRRLQKTFYEWKKLYSAVEMFLRRKERFIERPTEEEIASMYSVAEPFIRRILAQTSARPSRIPVKKTVMTAASRLKGNQTLEDVMELAGDLLADGSGSETASNEEQAN